MQTNQQPHSSRPKLLVLESLSRIGGGQRVLLDLLPALQAHFEVLVGLPGPGPLETELREMSVPTAHLPVKLYGLGRKSLANALDFVTALPRLSWAVRRLIQRHGIELVFANGGQALAWGTLGAVWAGRPAVWYSHVNFTDRKTLCLLRCLARRKTVARIAGTSPQAIEQFGLPGKSVVIPAGVDTAVFRPAPAARAAIRRELGIADDAPVVGNFGDLVPLKRQDLFLAAMLRVRRELPGAQFILVGAARDNVESARFHEALKPAALELGARILPWRRDLAVWYNALDLLVICSSGFETGPLVLYQALACGIPVVSAPIGRAPELLGDGAPGMLVSEVNAETLATAALALLRDPARMGQMRVAARARAEQTLELGKTQQRIVALLCDGLDCAGRRA